MKNFILALFALLLVAYYADAAAVRVNVRGRGNAVNVGGPAVSGRTIAGNARFVDVRTGFYGSRVGFDRAFYGGYGYRGFGTSFYGASAAYGAPLAYGGFYGASAGYSAYPVGLSYNAPPCNPQQTVIAPPQQTLLEETVTVRRYLIQQ